MSNVSIREKMVRVIEVTVPNPATRRDLEDLIRSADQRYRQIGRIDEAASLFDDAYTIEARDDEIVAIIKEDPS